MDFGTFIFAGFSFCCFGCILFKVGKFRFLFDQVRLDEHDIDFSMSLTKDPLEIIKAKARTWDCIKSPSIYLFYPLMLLILLAVIVLKCINVI